MSKVYVCSTEPEYEGGGSYNGVTDIVAVFKTREAAEEYCKRSRGLYDCEEVIFYDE